MGTRRFLLGLLVVLTVSGVPLAVGSAAYGSPGPRVSLSAVRLLSGSTLVVGLDNAPRDCRHPQFGPLRLAATDAWAVLGPERQPFARSNVSESVYWRAGSFLFYLRPAGAASSGVYPLTVYCGLHRVATASVRIDALPEPVRSRADAPLPLTDITGVALDLADGVHADHPYHPVTMTADFAPADCAAPRVLLDGRRVATQAPVHVHVPLDPDWWKVTITAQVPTRTRPGRHELALRCAPRPGLPDPLVRYPFVVIGASGAAGESVTTRRSPVLVAVPSMSDVPWGPGPVAVSALVAAVLLVLAEAGAAAAGRLPARWLPAWLPARWRPRGSPGRWFAGLAVATGVGYALADPTLGANGRTATLVAAMVVAVPVTALAAGRRPVPRGTPPVGLVLALLGVLGSRLAGYLPGVLIGPTAGGRPERRDPGRSALWGAVTLLAVSLVAWLEQASTARTSAPGAGLRFLDATLAAIFLVGVQALAFGLVPAPGSDGELARAGNRHAARAVHGLALFLCVHALVLHRAQVPGHRVHPVAAVAVLVAVLAVVPALLAAARAQKGMLRKGEE
ncbi:MAG: hypothetical protein ACJ73S_24555 [Mycobacteriales bacterium]